MTSMCDTPRKVKRLESAVQTVKKKSNRKENLTASIFCLLIVTVWVVGFKYTSIHAAMATLSLLIILPFPFSIISDSDAI